MSDFGCCPICGAPGRVRYPKGSDICENGHKYPSRWAVPKCGPPVVHGCENARDGEYVETAIVGVK